MKEKHNYRVRCKEKRGMTREKEIKKMRDLNLERKAVGVNKKLN
jgi:hypothetical protein